MYVSATQNPFYAYRSTAASAAAADPTATDATSAAGSSGSSGGVGQLYDFSHMTPAQMKEVAGKLNESGQINALQFLELSTAGVVAKVGPDGTPVPLSADEQAALDNTPTDYLQMAKNMIGNIESTGRTTDPTSGYENWKSLLALMQQLQSTPQSVDIRA
ncbi:hypothetical protein [Phenylobacterium sp.]|uniref:hypothetical protein n=1 Tax=Phenylobacterium sp. TaxID=1871053 RepID=UPI0035B4EDB6